MRGYKIFSGSANLEFAKQISKYLSLPLSDAGVKRFSDGEISVEKMFLSYKAPVLQQMII